jgi:hypothetical protein
MNIRIRALIQTIQVCLIIFGVLSGIVAWFWLCAYNVFLGIAAAVIFFSVLIYQEIYDDLAFKEKITKK